MLLSRNTRILVLALTALPSLTLAQNPTKVISVCKLLSNLNDYGNSVVAIVGRLDVTGVIYDRRNYVSQDGCETTIVTDNFLWPNKILISTTKEKGLPSPPTDTPDLPIHVLSQKLASMRATTILGMRK